MDLYNERIDDFILVFCSLCLNDLTVIKYLSDIFMVLS